MKTTIYSIVFTAVLILFFSCEKDNNNNNQLIFSGTLTNSSGCKNTKSGTTEPEISDTLSCINYVFNEAANKLILQHINAGFNCCPDSLYVQTSLNGNTITIEEFESSALCKCNCLYDLDIEITGIEAKKYTIEFKEPYAGEQQGIIFEMDLSNSYEGKFCVTRKLYPWGVGSID